MAVVASSLALLADAGHMLTDAAAIGASLLAIRLARRPAVGSLTFGLKRAEILSAQGNGITLLVVAGLVCYEAIRRLVHPPPVAGGILIVVALVGAAVNVAATLVLARADRSRLNVEGSFQHILTDLYAFLGTAIAGVVIALTGFTRADPIASLVVVGLMLHAAVGLLRASGRVLLEAAPEGYEPGPIARTIKEHPDVEQLHDMHVWLITSGFPALSAHVLVAPRADCHDVRRDLEELLAGRYGIDHTTLQVDHVPEMLLSIESYDAARRPRDGGTGTDDARHDAAR